MASVRQCMTTMNILNTSRSQHGLALFFIRWSGNLTRSQVPCGYKTMLQACVTQVNIPARNAGTSSRKHFLKDKKLQRHDENMVPVNNIGPVSLYMTMASPSMVFHNTLLSSTPSSQHLILQGREKTTHSTQNDSKDGCTDQGVVFCEDDNSDIPGPSIIDQTEHILYERFEAEKTFQRYPILRSSSATIRTLITALVNLEYDVDDVIQLLTKSPQLLSNPTKKVEDFLSFMTSQGFSQKQVRSVLQSVPQLVKMPSGGIVQVMGALRTIGITDGHLQHILATNPLLLTTKPDAILGRYGQLIEAFKKSDAMKIIKKCPCVFTDDWPTIEERVDYVINKMGLHQGHIVKSNLFNYDLEHLRIRHMFLERAGLYQKPDKHGVTVIENPSLSTIVESSDKQFATKVAGLSLAEFSTFKKIVDLEDEMMKLDEISDESDDEGNTDSDR